MVSTTAPSNYFNSPKIIMSQNNLTACQIDYFKTCWCRLNSLKPTQCSYLLRYVDSYSNASYFCTYHTIRKTMDCFDKSYIFPKASVSNMYIYFMILIFIVGLLGNGLSIITLIFSKLQRLNVYKNLAILCFLNILYLLTILIRYKNIYHQDLRNVSTIHCRIHSFIVAFIGHLCSWQLVSTCIQRLHALLSLKLHRAASWTQTFAIFFIIIVIPLFIFDAQILFNIGVFKSNQLCNEVPNSDIKQYQNALKYPIHSSIMLNNTSIKYHTFSSTTQSLKIKKHTCVVWNIFDTFLYAIIPFIIILICNFIIIIRVYQRRRSTTILGEVFYVHKRYNTSSDHLSTLLISINVLFIIMTGPLNIFLVAQSVHKCLLVNMPSMKNLFYLNECLRLLQNSYHALSFVFYCLIGKKFRTVAKSIGRTTYCKIIDILIPDTCLKRALTSCCLDRTWTTSTGKSTTSNSRANDGKRLTTRPNKNISLPLSSKPSPKDVSNHIHRKTVINTEASV